MRTLLIFAATIWSFTAVPLQASGVSIWTLDNFFVFSGSLTADLDTGALVAIDVTSAGSGTPGGARYQGVPMFAPGVGDGSSAARFRIEGGLTRVLGLDSFAPLLPQTAPHRLFLSEIVVGPNLTLTRGEIGALTLAGVENRPGPPDDIPTPPAVPLPMPAGLLLGGLGVLAGVRKLGMPRA